MSLVIAVISLLATVSTIGAPPAAPSVQPSPAAASAVRAVWPLQPPVVERGFEPPSVRWSAGHRGVDLLGAIGSPVVAARGGTVSFTGVIAGRGVVVVDHGDVRTTYEPVVSDVMRGDIVRAGDRIGTLDVTQSHCFPEACLHWGLIRRADDAYLDPLTLIESRRVRLLPLTSGVSGASTPREAHVPAGRERELCTGADSTRDYG